MALAAAPRGRRPARMSTVNALTSWMCEFGSSTTDDNSLAASPVLNPLGPQWYGRPTWCTMRSATLSGVILSVTRTRASITARGLTMVAHSPLVSPRSSASSGDTSQNISGCNSDR